MMDNTQWKTAVREAMSHNDMHANDEMDCAECQGDKRQLAALSVSHQKKEIQTQIHSWQAAGISQASASTWITILQRIEKQKRIQ